MTYNFKKTLAVLAAVVCIGIVVWCIYDLMVGYSREKPSILVTLAVFYAAAAGWAIHWLVQKERSLRLGPADHEEILLRLMSARGGRITPDEATADSGLPPQTVRAALQRLCRKGACQLRATATGDTVYVTSNPV